MVNSQTFILINVSVTLNDVRVLIVTLNGANLWIYLTKFPPQIRNSLLRDLQHERESTAAAKEEANSLRESTEESARMIADLHKHIEELEVINLIPMFLPFQKKLAQVGLPLTHTLPSHSVQTTLGDELNGITSNVHGLLLLSYIFTYWDSYRFRSWITRHTIIIRYFFPQNVLTKQI